MSLDDEIVNNFSEKEILLVILATDVFSKTRQHTCRSRKWNVHPWKFLSCGPTPKRLIASPRAPCSRWTVFLNQVLSNRNNTVLNYLPVQKYTLYVWPQYKRWLEKDGDNAYVVWKSLLTVDQVSFQLCAAHLPEWRSSGFDLNKENFVNEKVEKQNVENLCTKSQNLLIVTPYKMVFLQKEKDTTDKWTLTNKKLMIGVGNLYDGKDV